MPFLSSHSLSQSPVPPSSISAGVQPRTRSRQGLAGATLTSGPAGAGKLSQSRSSHLSWSQSEAQTLTRRSELVASQSSPPSTPKSWYCGAETQPCHSGSTEDLKEGDNKEWDRSSL